MRASGVNSEVTFETQRISGPRTFCNSLFEAAILTFAVDRGDATLGKGGARFVTTGKRTGRPPDDEFVVHTRGVVDII